MICSILEGGKKGHGNRKRKEQETLSDETKVLNEEDKKKKQNDVESLNTWANKLTRDFSKALKGLGME